MTFDKVKWRHYEIKIERDNTIINECAQSARYFAGRAIHLPLERQLASSICWPTERVTAWKVFWINTNHEGYE